MVFIQLRDPTLLRADDPGEVPEMIDRKRQISCHGLTDRLAVIPGLDRREQLQVLFHALRNTLQHAPALGNRAAPPSAFRSMCGVKSQVHIGSRGACNLAQELPRHRGKVFKVFPRGGRNPASTNVVVILPAKGEGKAIRPWLKRGCGRHTGLLLCKWAPRPKGARTAEILSP